MYSEMKKKKITSIYQLNTVKKRMITAFLIERSKNDIYQKKEEIEDVIPDINIDVESVEKELKQIEGDLYPYCYFC